jgi:hypothetical protein
MVRDIPSFVFCYRFYLVINKIKVKFVKVSMCVDVTKLYETSTLNAIAIFKFISK